MDAQPTMNLDHAISDTVKQTALHLMVTSEADQTESSATPPAFQAKYAPTPAPRNSPLQIPQIDLADSGKFPSLGLSDEKAKQQQTNELLKLQFASLETLGDYKFLTLPSLHSGLAAAWHDEVNTRFTSRRMLVRSWYERAATTFLDYAMKNPNKRNHMLLSGTSGIGKTFFSRYFIWRLLHADGKELTETPITILYLPPSDLRTWHLYHDGRVYIIQNIQMIFGTQQGMDMLDLENAWVITDGLSPQRLPLCNTLVITSPGNLQIDHSKSTHKFGKGTILRQYLPVWSPQEIWAAAGAIYNLDGANDKELLALYRKYGGVARSIFQSFEDEYEDIWDEMFNGTNLILAMNQTGAKKINDRAILGQVLHLIPDASLRNCSYQWGSTEIMMRAFRELFKLTKEKTTCLIEGAMSLHTRTFYGLLFEPYFHERVKSVGYKGRFRMLNEVSPDTEGHRARRSKRNLCGLAKDRVPTRIYKIPQIPINIFHSLSEIQPAAYNVPDRKNFAAVDAICPDRGELYQVTSAEQHPIKARHLLPLRRFFKGRIDAGLKVRLIFVVPPSRFDDFIKQKYVQVGDKARGESEGEGCAARPMERATAIPEEGGQAAEAGSMVPNAAQDPSSSQAQFDTWLDQCVLEMDVGNLTQTFNERMIEEIKNKIRKLI